MTRNRGSKPQVSQKVGGTRIGTLTRTIGKKSRKPTTKGNSKGGTATGVTPARTRKATEQGNSKAPEVANEDAQEEKQISVFEQESQLSDDMHDSESDDGIPREDVVLVQDTEEAEHHDEEKSSEVPTPTAECAGQASGGPARRNGALEDEQQQDGRRESDRGALRSAREEPEKVRIRAHPRQVVFVNGIKNPRGRFSNFDIREELEKFFPGKAWRAHFIRNGGLRISGFKWQSEVDFITSINWNSHFGEKGAPFGGCDHPVKPRISVPTEVLARDVCMLVEGKIDQEMMVRRLAQDRYHGVEVISSGKVVNPKWHRLVRFRMRSIDDHNRIILEGVRFGAIEDFAVSWCARDRESRCYNCQSRGSSHLANNCQRATVCPRCSGAHPLKECKATQAELKCPACSNRHPVWSEKCPVALRRMMAESERIGVPYPPFWAGVRLASLHSQRAVQIPNSYASQVTHEKGTFAQRAGGGNFLRGLPSRANADAAHPNQEGPAVVQGIPKGGASYRNGGMSDKPSRMEVSERRIEENVSAKVIKQGLSLFRRVLTTLLREVDEQRKVRVSNVENVDPVEAESLSSDKNEMSGEVETIGSSEASVKTPDGASFDTQNLLKSTNESTLNLVTVLMRSLLKILGPDKTDEDDDDLEDGEISQLLSELSVK